ncbi:lipid-A-disaccharide synthase [Crocinitomicaceae bacterium CZZ-1]|uniref:Lipid-A-disaccharide synthase n=1 Tax=Taishania pollutisoli TaxID=2766479 RepID=A0A8J6PIU9_9FLAO|nr:lipid-A-disaccharide synthase [Taishania pollutisoli]MBC9812419.1 lipid-A-disaccharide synthase [Taishania pollutisoli]NGF74383.1 lipid-A-disaccharide synthase [Fluviicola sp. SGL-29]
MAHRYYVIAGEASGDLHGSNLMKAMLQEQPDCDFRFWGGDEMSKAGGTRVKHIKELAFMGFVEVLMNLRTILGNLKFCKNDILHYKPDALILIDYPGFNLRIAEWAHEQGIRVIYYISPQVWAWKQNRVHTIKKVVDEMYVILPFEKDFYRQFNFEVTYVGHPLLDAIENYKSQVSETRFFERNSLKECPVIAILPGSRKQEVKKKLPIMLEAVKELKGYQVIVAGAPSLDASFYQPFLQEYSNVSIVHSQTYDLLSNAEAAIVTSGTATLETALFEVPEVVCYIGSPISYLIARQLIKIKFISLVNLIMDREVVKELIQKECNPTSIRGELNRLVIGGTKREQMLADYKTMKEILGGGGASKKIAQSVLKTNV